MDAERAILECIWRGIMRAEWEGTDCGWQRCLALRLIKVKSDRGSKKASICAINII